MSKDSASYSQNNKFRKDENNLKKTENLEV